MNEQFTNQLFVFKSEMNNAYAQAHRIVLKDIETFKGVCMQFYFSTKPGEEHFILFVKKEEIFTLDIRNGECCTLY